MSNDLVGNLYYNVINDVVNESRQDFEDSGIDEDTLQQLRLVWQQRLSQLTVAPMPWENGLSLDREPTGLRLGGGPTAAASGVSVRGPQVKSEYIIENPGNPGGANGLKRESGAEIPGLLDSSEAALRAAQEAQNLAREHRGIVPGVDDSGYHANSDANGNGGGLVLPGGGHLAQADGASDLPLTTAEVDKLIAHKLATASEDELNGSSNIEITVDTNKLQKIMRQADGASDQSDEINSDLDDSDDEIDSANEDEDDDGGMIILCLYDKVQRVKNKWKYVLKDGIANINGKDYVFSRGAGESEW